MLVTSALFNEYWTQTYDIAEDDISLKDLQALQWAQKLKQVLSLFDLFLVGQKQLKITPDKIAIPSSGK